MAGEHDVLRRGQYAVVDPAAEQFTAVVATASDAAGPREDQLPAAPGSAAAGRPDVSTHLATADDPATQRNCLEIGRFRCTGMTGGPTKIIAGANGCMDLS